MDGNTALILINIFIICVIAIIIVKLYYRDEELENKENNMLNNSNSSFTQSISSVKGMISSNTKSSNNKSSAVSRFFTNQESNNTTAKHSLRKKGSVPQNDFNQTITPKQERKRVYPTKPNFHGETRVYEFQEPIEQSHRDIMNQNNNNDTVQEVEINQKDSFNNQEEVSSEEKSSSNHELKDLFTIDELIKESKRKDSKRENEANKLKEKVEEIKQGKIETAEKEEIKEEKIIDEKVDDTPAIPTIESAIKSKTEDEKIKNDAEEIESAFNKKESKPNTIEEIIQQPEPTNTIDEVIQETEEPVNTLDEEIQQPQEEIGTPTLKTPTKVDDISENDEIYAEIPQDDDQPSLKETYIAVSPEVRDEEASLDPEEQDRQDKQYSNDGISLLTPKEEETNSALDNSEMFEEENELDYRKDLAKITNKVKNSKIFSEVRNRILVNDEEEYDPNMDEDFLRDIRDYDAPTIEEPEPEPEEDDFPVYEPIYNETYEAYKPIEEEIVEEPEEVIVPKRPAPLKETTPKIKSAPVKQNITFTLNNNKEVLHVNDEIIYTHNGDTYSSKVYKIAGDDISVRFRGQNIKIKTSDIKKIF